MSYNFFRHSPVYENALRTPDVLERPQSPTAFFRRNREPLADFQVKGAGYRLDHLIRNALNPRFTDFPLTAQLSAIKHFVETIEPQLEKVSSATQAEINPRLAFCRELLTQADRDLVEYGYSKVSADAFRQLVIEAARWIGTNPLEQIVFKNPFCYFAGAATPLSTSRGMLNFFEKIKHTPYWS